MSNLVKRTLSGAVYCAVVIAAILFHPLAASVLFAFIAVLAVWEFCKLMNLDLWMKLSSALAALLLWLSHAYPINVGGYMLFLMLVLMAELYRKQENPIISWGYFLVGQMMIALPLALTNDILVFHGWPIGRYVLLALFVCIWSNDTGAYCVGSLIGKHKMFPRVSPKKSWEGLVGGFVFSLLSGFLFSVFVKDIALWQWLLLAFTVSVFGTFGDLMESLLKRTIGVKDSGKFLPGHGGVLDRFDSVLLAVPAVYILLHLFANMGL